MRRLVLLLILLSILPWHQHRADAHAPAVVPTRPDALRVTLAAPGRQVIARATLIAAGWPDTTDLRRVAVWRHDQPMPRQVQGETLILVTAPNESPFTTQMVVWLTREAATVPDADLPDATAPLRWDADTLWAPDAPSGRGGGDAWYLADLRPAAPSVTLALTTPVDLPIGTPLQLALTTTRAGPHMLTGSAFAPIAWSGRGPITLTTTLTQALPAGTPTLTLATGGSRLLLDTLTLPSILTPLPDPPPPVITPGFGPLPVAPPGGVLILAPAAWHAALAPLVAAYQATGDAVRLLDPQHAADGFSGGERDPQAIRALLQQTRPRLAILVGATTARLRDDPDVAIPPYLIVRDGGVIACETCFARLDGADPTDDMVPDLVVTRWPVTSAAETAALVARILAQRSAMPPAGAATAILLTDNDVQADGTPDPAGSFGATAQVARQALGSAWTIQPFAYDPQSAAPDVSRHVGRLRTDLFAAWDAGAGLLVYVGHASWWQWAATDANADVPYLAYLYDADARLVQGMRPIILSMTCRSGDVSVPYLEAMDARLVRLGGGIASVGFSGDGVNTGHARLLARLVPRLRAGQRLGDAVQGALADLVQAGETSDLIWTISVQGDADTRLWGVASRMLLPFAAGGPQ